MWPGRATGTGPPPSGCRKGRWLDRGREGHVSPAVAVLDANVAAAVELLAVLEPAVGGLRVARRCLALQGLPLTHLSRLALHLLQLGPGGCGVQGREVSMGVGARCQVCAVEGGPLSSGVEGWPGKPPLPGSFPTSIRSPRVCSDINVAATYGASFTPGMTLGA